MKSRTEITRRGTPSRTNGTALLDGLHRHPKSAVVVGTGFIALDIVIAEGQGQRPRTWAGGSCGNVMAILAYLGWSAYPVSTLGTDTGADRIIEDLTAFGVDVRFIQREPERRTPIVIERIRKVADGIPRSRFVWTCPGCGAWLPGYQPLLAKNMKTIVSIMPDPAVFFFDRVSRGALNLAAAAAKRGALVVFEPSGVRDERLSGISDRIGGGMPLLEIETLGADGLRYRLQGQSVSRGWQLMDAYSVPQVRDTVGAGDWCTAGLINVIGVHGAEGLRQAAEAEVEHALRVGQALGAFGCAYEGARGGMYALGKRQFRAAIGRILDGGAAKSRVERDDVRLEELWELVCPACASERREQADSGAKTTGSSVSV